MQRRSRLIVRLWTLLRVLTARRPGDVPTPLSFFFPHTTFGSRATLVPIDLTAEQPQPAVAMQLDLDEVNAPMQLALEEELDDTFFDEDEVEQIPFDGDEDEVEQIPFDGDLDGAKSPQVKAALERVQKQDREMRAHEKSDSQAALRKVFGNAPRMNREPTFMREVILEAMKSRDPERMVCHVPAAPKRDAIGRRIRPKRTDFIFKGLE
jgi:hypothetical protein